MAAAAGLTGSSWPAGRLARLDGPGRVAGVDLARGLAVIGMFAAHLLNTEALVWSDPATWTDVVNGRSSILFATLAGLSIGLTTSRPAESGGERAGEETDAGAPHSGRMPLRGAELDRARVRLAARAALIWLIGILVVGLGVPVLVILPAYGILFLLAMPFLSLRPRALFALAAAFALVMPFAQPALDALPFWSTTPGEAISTAVGWHYPFPVWIAFVLAGLGAGRLRLRSAGTAWALLGVGAALAAVGYGTAVAIAGRIPVSSAWSAVFTADAHSSGLFEVVGSGGFAFAVIGLCLLLCRSWASSAPIGVVGRLLLPLRAVGSMPLTAYVAQLVVWALVATEVLGAPGDLGGFRALDPFWPFAVWTIVGCTAWTLLVGRGPLEWLIDVVSRGAVAAAERTDPGPQPPADRLEE